MNSGTGVFVAYAEPDRAWVQGFLVPSVQMPSIPVLTMDQFAPGASLLREVESAIGRVQVTVLVISKAFLADEWSLFSDALATTAELGRGPGRASRRHATVVPLLLDDVDVPLHLDAKVSLDCRRTEDWEPAMARLRGLLSAPKPSEEELPCPYPGMTPFHATQESVFFGRDAELEELCVRVANQPLLAVLGPSGCGKSSLALGGLTPRIGDSADIRWIVRTTQPGAAPFQDLRRALSASPDTDPRDIMRSVTALLREHGDRDRVLLVVDQAETIFAQASASGREAFITAVQALRASPVSCLLLILRADALADLMESRLWPLDQHERLELATLSRQGLKEAIERPATAVGVYIEPVLVERLLHDCAQEPGALPLLQETLRLLWQRRSRRLLTLSAYEDLAGTDASLLATALVMHADAALASLSPVEQVVARRVLLRLVQPGDGRPHTRRREPLSSVRHTSSDRATADRVIQHLSKRRILTVGRPGPHDQAHVDLAHESLIMRWDVLVRWIDEHRADETRRRRLEQDAQIWSESRRNRELVYRGHPLQEAWAWARSHPGELSDTGTSFLAAGRRRRGLRKAAVGTLAIATAWGLFASGQPRYQQYQLRQEAIQLGPQVRVAGGELRAWGGAPADRIQDLLVDVHEVTNSQYGLCEKAERCPEPMVAPNATSAEDYENLPVVEVTARHAFDYCRWVGRRLPTAREWLWTAIGASGGPYPWGRGRPTPRRANLEFSNGSTVGHYGLMSASSGFELGATPEGVLHLLGNAMEWTASEVDYGDDTSWSIGKDWNGQRGGVVLAIGASFAEPSTTLPQSATPTLTVHNYDNIGFRCVKTPG